MLFSVCVPTFNRAYCIARPLKSLLNQTFRDFEVVIVDDGSTDNTEEVVSEFKNSGLIIRYFKQSNGGKHTALNTGVRNAKGELFLILDSDDELVPEALQLLADKWKKDGNMPNICGIMARCSSEGKLVGKPFPPELKEMSYVYFHYGKGSGVYGDCCECVKTDILKQYTWPVIEGTKFVPENYVADQIGLKYKLLLLSHQLEKKIYLESDGITKNVLAYQKKNYLGYLYNAASKIDIILPNSKEVTLSSKIKIWMRYWKFVDYDKEAKGARCNYVSVLGWITRILYQIKKLH